LLATAIRYKFELPKYIYEPLVIGGVTYSDLKRKRLAAGNGGGRTLAVEYESCVSEVVDSVIT